MKQADLNRAVALATGESVTTIKQLGFQLEQPLEAWEPECMDLGPQVIDWDVPYDSQRRTYRVPVAA